MYILITPLKVYYSKMLTPLARMAGVERRTIKRWLNNPALARKKGYEVYVAYRAKDYKGRSRI